MWCGGSLGEAMVPKAASYTQRIRRMNQRFLIRMRRILPPGTRWFVGLLLICGGILGFMPILGFWMIPLGIGVAALDIKPMARWVQNYRIRRRK